MTLRMKGSWILAGLGVLAMMVGDVREAQAGMTSAIVVKGGYKTGGGDPFYDYVFQVFLEPPTTPGSNSLITGDSFTVNSLPGVTSSSSSSVTLPSPLPDGATNYSWSSPTFTPTSNPYLSFPFTAPSYAADVQWTYTGSSTISTSTNEIYLGQFSVLSTYNFAESQVPMSVGATVTYSFTFDGQAQSGSGSFPIASLPVPEPSSAILLLAGTGILPFYWLRERRRQR